MKKIEIYLYIKYILFLLKKKKNCFIKICFILIII